MVEHIKNTCFQSPAFQRLCSNKLFLEVTFYETTEKIKVIFMFI